MKTGKIKLYVLGDSISIGYGPFLEIMTKDKFSYSRKTGEEEALKNLDIPEGANGGDSGMVLSYLRLLVKQGQFKSDYFLINCGLHDLKRDKESGTLQIHLEQYHRNLEHIVAILPELAKQIVWISTTPVNEKIHNKHKPFDRFESDVKDYNDAANKVMKTAGIPVADLNSFTSSFTIDENATVDGVHFNEYIQTNQAAFLAGFLNAMHT